MKIGVIGAGHIGGTLAARLVATGHEVAISNSRGPETLQGAVDGARPKTVEDAARFSEVFLSLAESQLALAALTSLCAGERDAVEVLRRLLSRVRPTVAASR